MIHEDQRDESDPRLKNIIEHYREGRKYDVGIVGAPFDYGVKLSNGRTGAKFGPDAFRIALKRYGTAYDIGSGADISRLRVCDFGNIETVEEDSTETHKRVSDVVAAITRMGAVPVVIGGGHDISFADVRGLCMATKGAVGGLNIDAHFDVRRVIDGSASSGTPFRRVLEELSGRVRGSNFIEIGAHDNLNSKVYRDYLVAKKARIITLDEMRESGMKATMRSALRKAGSGAGSIFLSIDVDAMPQSAAPGCSAPSARGVEPDEILQACFAAGADGKVKLMDIMELNPNYDLDMRTAILAATMFVSFLDGFSRREKVKL